MIDCVEANCILKEYLFLQQTIEDFNKQVIEFKSWSVTFGIAALIAAYTKPVSSAGRVGVAVAGLSAIPFWLTESFWKLSQHLHGERTKDIEKCLSDGCTDLKPLQIYTSWFETLGGFWTGVGHWLGVAFQPNVITPYVFLLATGLVLAWRFPPPASTE
ncbi:hypothetical protein [Pelagibius sp.]|uniref:hypothetical protein n=1 Tax=Pelagibius sp. TaxID=1931238 RepID=UPI003BB13834